jgi:hypothetical protein
MDNPDENLPPAIKEHARFSLIQDKSANENPGSKSIGFRVRVGHRVSNASSKIIRPNPARPGLSRRSIRAAVEESHVLRGVVWRGFLWIHKSLPASEF